jgi:NTP pyrophosphatase (non-canonical NTP hydrolase)
MSDNSYPFPEHGWTCFHCGETFTTPGTARIHFGARPTATPGCLLKVQHGEERAMLMEMRQLEDGLREITSIPPTLIGRWHHGNGVIVAGGTRIAREDFDSDPAAEFKKEFWDWVCNTMNSAIRLQRPAHRESTFVQHVFHSVMGKFQHQWDRWMRECYGHQGVVKDPDEANRRFIEEALEVVQSLGMSKEEALFMVDYVYSRPKGEPSQETAGALATLVTLCNVHNIDLGQAALADLNDCWQRISQIRNKQANKPKYEVNRNN